MTYVITSPCVGVCDAACTTVCPVDCIAGPVPLEDIEATAKGERKERLGLFQLYINPDECIFCGACQPMCPVDAIYAEDDVPAEHRGSIAENEAFFAA